MTLTVLHVVNRLASHGGAESSLVALLPELQQRGLRNVVVPLFPYDDGGARGRLEAAGVRVEDPLDLPAARTVPALLRLLRSVGPDVVHTTLWESDLHGRVAGVLAGVPVLTSLVNTQYAPHAVAAAPSPRRLEVVRRLDGLLARQTDALLHAVTQAVADEARRALRVDPARVRVVPRGRDRTVLGEPSRAGRAATLAGLGLPVDADVVLALGRHEAQKDHRTLVQALAGLVATRPAVHLLVAGREGTQTAALRDLVDRLGLGPRVHLLGPRPDVPDLLRAADAFAFPSLWEGLGGAVLEAMAMEVPVVAADIPPVREVLGGTGRLVPPQDPDALCAALQEVLADPAAARRQAAAARARFDAVYDLPRVADAMAALYAEAAATAVPDRPPVARLLARGRRPEQDPYARPEVLAAYVGATGLTDVEADLLARHVPPGSRVLDLGVGSGRTTPALSAGASRYVGVDVSAAMVAACRAAFPDLDFRVGDAARLDGLDDASFDVVVFSFNGIDHLHGADRAACLAECARVLRPGGTLVFSAHNPRAVLVVPASASPRVLATSALRTARRSARRMRDRAFWTGDGRVHEPVHGGLDLTEAVPSVWARLVAEAGLELLEVRPCGPRRAPGPLEADWYYYAARRP